MAACGQKKDAKEAAEKKEDEKPKKKVENYMDGLEPQDRMNAIKKIFNDADTSHDKLVDLDEWVAANKAHIIKDEKREYTDKDLAECKKTFAEIDKTNNGTISLAELDLYVTTKQLDAVRERFKNADKSKDRKLDKKEFNDFFKKEGMKKKNIDKLWNKCDTNGDGKVSYQEFGTWMEREMADGVLAETFGEGYSGNELVEAKKKAAEAKKAKKDKAKK